MNDLNALGSIILSESYYFYYSLIFFCFHLFTSCLFLNPPFIRTLALIEPSFSSFAERSPLKGGFFVPSLPIGQLVKVAVYKGIAFILSSVSLCAH